MNTLILFVLFTGLATLVAGESKIVGGAEVAITSYPYEVYLQTDKRVCSGSIIGATWVITTAICLDGATQVNIRAGSANRLSGGSTHTGYVMYIHPKYITGSYDYNFGLIMIWPPFPIGALGYSTIKMPWYNPLPGTIVWASGWGSTTATGSMVTILRAVSMAVTTPQICQSYYSDVIMNPTIVCAGGTGVNICFGDGGGSLVNQNTGELYGMGSFMRSCRTDGGPAGFTNVANQRYWIYSVTGI